MELSRNGCWKSYLQYRKLLRKCTHHTLRIGFIENCLKSSIIPRFLKFRIPNNGCFDEKSVHDFQLRLLRKELFVANGDRQKMIDKLHHARDELKHKAPSKSIPSIILHSNIDIRNLRKSQKSKLDNKLFRLSDEQERPLFERGKYCDLF